MGITAMLAAIADTAAAQAGELDAGAEAAYFAITTTTVGATTLHAPTVFSTTSTKRLRAQVGHADDEGDVSQRSLMVGLDIPAGSTVFGFDAGITDFVCDVDELKQEFGIDVDCATVRMVGARWSSRLDATSFGSQSATTLELGIEVAAGMSFGKYLEIAAGGAFGAFSTTNLAASLSLPLVFVVRTGRVTIVPMLSPGFAYGRSSQTLQAGVEEEEVEESGARFMLSAGVGMMFGDSALGLDAGIRQVFAEDAAVVVGAGVSIRVR